MNKRAPPILYTKKTELPISIYLLKNCKLWVWDWDDTLIDTTAYLKRSMTPQLIRNLTDTQLTEDVPNWRYFRQLVEYIVKHGIYVGIASFGTYEIIRGYMDRIFGFNQHYFTSANIMALCTKDRSNPSYKVPKNKNKYIYELMKFYKIQSFQDVVLFDDNQTNITDGNIIGINSILVSSETLFGPDTLIKVDQIVKDKCDQPLLISSKFKDINNTSIITTPDGQHRYNNDDISNVSRVNMLDITSVDNKYRPIDTITPIGNPYEHKPSNSMGITDGINPPFMYDTGSNTNTMIDTGAELLSMRRRYSAIGDRKASKNLEGFKELPVRDIHPTRFGEYFANYGEHTDYSSNIPLSTSISTPISTPISTQTQISSDTSKLIASTLSEMFNWNKYDLILLLIGIAFILLLLYKKYSINNSSYSTKILF